MLNHGLNHCLGPTGCGNQSLRQLRWCKEHCFIPIATDGVQEKGAGGLSHSLAQNTRLNLVKEHESLEHHVWSDKAKINVFGWMGSNMLGVNLAWASTVKLTLWRYGGCVRAKGQEYDIYRWFHVDADCPYESLPLKAEGESSSMINDPKYIPKNKEGRSKIMIWSSLLPVLIQDWSDVF